MEHTAACPDPSRYQSLIDGSLSAVEVEELARHLESCPTCAGTLAQLGDDTLSSALRTAARSGTDSEATQIERIVGASRRLAVDHEAATVTGVGDTDSRTADATREDDSINLAFLAPPQTADEVGRLDGYRILRLLGHGGMGLVFEAEDVRLKRRVALKVMKPEVAARKQHRERFLREAQAAAKVEHDHIVPIYQVGEENGVPFIAMPFLKGEALDSRLKGNPLPVSDILTIGRQVADGLAAAHAHGLIHRDIKPGNVWLEAVVSGQWSVVSQNAAKDRGPLPTRVRILDFGLARLSGDEAHLTQAGVIMGTPAYMAPEQARGQAVDPRADLFSLGCVLYEMSTGRRPFSGSDTMAVLSSLALDTPAEPKTLNPEIPTALSKLIVRLLEKNPEARPESAATVADALRTMPLVDPPMAEAAPAVAKCRSRQSSALIAIAASLLLIGGGLAAYKLFFQTKDGTLVVEVDGDADVRFKNGELRIYDADGKLKYSLKPNERNVKMPPGKYTVKVFSPDGQLIVTPYFQIEENRKATVWVTAEASSAVALELPKRASDIKVFSLGNWRTETVIYEPKLPPARARTVGISTYDLVADGKFLRGHTSDFDGHFEVLSIQSFDDTRNAVSGWMFMANGEATGPGSGFYDADKHSLLWMEKLPNGNQATQQIEFVDGDTNKSRLFHQDPKNRIVLDIRNEGKRLDGPQNHQPFPPDPNRPPEMKVLDRVVGEWRNEGTTGTADEPGKRIPHTSHINARPILAGRFIEWDETIADLGRKDYGVLWYDSHQMRYRFWHFTAVGVAAETVGTWDEMSQTMRWAATDGSVKGHWTFKSDDLCEIHEAVKDKNGKWLIEHDGVSRRIKEGSPESGWISLFNGKDLRGWAEVQDKGASSSAKMWDVVGGVLVMRGEPAGIIRTRQEFRQFHLSLEMRSPASAGNLGMYAAILWELDNTPLRPPAWPKSGRLEIVREKGVEQFIAYGLRQDNLFKRTLAPLGNPGADRWNKLEVICKDGELEIRVNGASHLIKDNHPGLGYVGLQNIGGGAQFRNIRIKELSTSVDPADQLKKFSAADKPPARDAFGAEPLFYQTYDDPTKYADIVGKFQDWSRSVENGALVTRYKFAESGISAPPVWFEKPATELAFVARMRASRSSINLGFREFEGDKRSRSLRLSIEPDGNWQLARDNLKRGADGDWEIDKSEILAKSDKPNPYFQDEKWFGLAVRAAAGKVELWANGDRLADVADIPPADAKPGKAALWIDGRGESREGRYEIDHVAIWNLRSEPKKK
jgi:serine/threonine protein kinase